MRLCRCHRTRRRRRYQRWHSTWSAPLHCNTFSADKDILDEQLLEKSRPHRAALISADNMRCTYNPKNKTETPRSSSRTTIAHLNHNHYRRCLLESSKRFMPKKQRDELSAAALQLPLVLGAVRRASGELALAATIELNAAASAAASADSPSLSPPLAAADAAAAAAVHALLALQALLNASLKLDVQPSSLSAALQAASLLSAASPLALADRVVRRLHDLHAIAVALAQSASVFVSSKEAELVAKAGGDAKRIANAVLPLGKGVRASIARMGEAGAEAAFAVQGEGVLVTRGACVGVRQLLS